MVAVATHFTYSAGASYRRRFGAARQKSQRQSADREDRDQLLDADGADHLEAGGDQHRIGQHGLRGGFRRLRGLFDPASIWFLRTM